MYTVKSAVRFVMAALTTFCAGAFLMLFWMYGILADGYRVSGRAEQTSRLPAWIALFASCCFAAAAVAAVFRIERGHSGWLQELPPRSFSLS